MYQISRIINNNIVASKDQNGKEVLLRGLGIGFGMAKGDEVPENKIEKIYKISNYSEKSKLETLNRDISKEYVDISKDILEYAKKILSCNLSDSIIFSLADHISFAITRKKNNMEITNPMINEIKKFYPKEFLAAKYALGMIYKKLGVKLKIDEAGFIAVYFVNAKSSL